jgi:hypothetical protein
MSIYDILASKPHNQHYLKRYINFVVSCQQKNVGYDGYTESHHICPKATWPEYTNLARHPWNKALLTPRQHFIAHIILEKAFGSVESKRALFMMSSGRWKAFISYSKTYERLRQELFPIWSENGRRSGVYNKGKTVVKDEDGNTLRVAVDDPRLKTGELVGVIKGSTTATDRNGNTFNISVNDPRFSSGEIFGIAKGRKIVKDKDGNTFSVSATHPAILSGELTSVSKGMMPAKDKTGNVHWIANDDPRFLSGELVSTTVGKTVVKDKEGNTLRVTVDDPRLKAGELVGITSGTVTVRDKNGKCFRVPKDEPRYLSGELVPITLGIPAKIKGKVCYNDGNKNIYLSNDEAPPFGFRKGSFSSSKKTYNNGKIEIKAVDGEQPDGFVKGTLFKKVWVTDGKVSKYAPLDQIPDGFVKGRLKKTKQLNR